MHLGCSYSFNTVVPLLHYTVWTPRNLRIPWVLHSTFLLGFLFVRSFGLCTRVKVNPVATAFYRLEWLQLRFTHKSLHVAISLYVVPYKEWREKEKQQSERNVWELARSRLLLTPKTKRRSRNAVDPFREKGVRDGSQEEHKGKIEKLLNGPVIAGLSWCNKCLVGAQRPCWRERRSRGCKPLQPSHGYKNQNLHEAPSPP